MLEEEDNKTEKDEQMKEQMRFLIERVQILADKMEAREKSMEKENELLRLRLAANQEVARKEGNGEPTDTFSCSCAFE